METPESYIMIHFKEPGSVVFQVKLEGVTPLQMMAIASYLEIKGKNAMIREENERMEREVQQQLSIPKPDILIPGRS